MKRILAIVAAAAALATTATLAATPQERGEARLAELLDGFQVSGEGRDCISAFRSNRIRVIPYVGVIYDDGDTVYVARAAQPEMLRYSSVPVFKRHTAQLCRTDVIRTIDASYPGFSEVLFLDDFIPYTRVKKASGS